MTKAELLRAARRRVSLPLGELWLDYQDDVEELVGIEIMDITGQLKYANPS